MNRLLRWLWIVSVGLLIVFCLWGLIVDTRELRLLEDERGHLEAQVGRMVVDDESRIHVLNVQNNGPDQFLWRAYLPAGHAWRMSYQLAKGGGGYTSSGVRNEPQDTLIRIRLIQDEGSWQLIAMSGTGSSTWGMPDEVATFLIQNWDELLVESAGPQQLSLSTDKVVTVLSIRVPESLMPQAGMAFGGSMVEELREEPLLIYEIGSESAFAAREVESKP